MRSDDDTTAQRVSRLLDQGRQPPPETGHEPWPSGWPSENASSTSDSDILGDRLAGRFGVGPRWQVSVRAAAAAAVLGLLAVAVVAILLLRGPSPGTVVPGRDPIPFGSPPTALASAAATGSVSADPGAAPVGDANPGTASVGTAAGTPTGQLRVYVVGQVRHSGVVTLGMEARVEDAIQAVGGATEKADLAVMNLARKVVDGERIVVPRPGEKVPTPDPVPAPGAAGAGVPSGATGGGAVVPGTPLDLNVATVAQLDALPGVGPVIAGRIVAWRQENGRFSQVDDLGEVQGIGDATLAKLRPLVRV
jgi:competence protein ComEA